MANSSTPAASGASATSTADQRAKSASHQNPAAAAGQAPSQTSTTPSAQPAGNAVSHQYSAHYTGGDQSSLKRPQEMSALDRLKCI